MTESLQRYLSKRADLNTRTLHSKPREDVNQVVVIPALAEGANLFHTLACLARNSTVELERTLVICVVNNREPALADPGQIQDNQDTLAKLRGLVEAAPAPDLREIAERGLRVGYVDASSPGCEFPEKGGVGLARKIGLDWGLAVLQETGTDRGILLCLDADTLVDSNYLSAIRAHFARRDAWAGVVAYAHPLDGTVEEAAAIVCYELFLRYYVLGLRYARSPYAFPSIGSTMVCTPEAYVAVSGMNQRQAGEDFYFLQQLAKTGRVDTISATTVYPSSRASTRVPFGTGMRVRRFLSSPQRRDEYRVYDPRSFTILKKWLTQVEAHLELGAEDLLAHSGEIDERLKDFLRAQGFAQTWPRLQAHAHDTGQLHAQFHRWFDGFKTLKLIHFLRDAGLPDQDMFDSIATVMQWMGLARSGIEPAGIHDRLPAQQALLSYLREREAMIRSQP